MKSDIITMLDAMSEAALRLAQSDLVRQKAVVPVVLFRHRKDFCGQLEIPEELGAALNYPGGCAIFYGGLRALVEIHRPLAICIAIETWVATPTKAGESLPPKVFERLMREHGFVTALEMGICERYEALSVLAQSRQYARMTVQRFERGEDGSITFGTKEVSDIRQDQLQGGMKMYDTADGTDGPIQ